VSSKFAVSSIQLRFTFMRGLHPFYPPRVEVLRPHLSTPLPGALASHPLLRLEHWHPTMTMTQLVENIRTFLEVRAGVHLFHSTHPLNRPCVHVMVQSVSQWSAAL
jgi:baculoviral IAP repeat-containing protein 6